MFCSSGNWTILSLIPAQSDGVQSFNLSLQILEFFGSCHWISIRVFFTTEVSAPFRSNPLFLTQVSSRLGTACDIHLTCGSRGGVGMCMEQKSLSKFLPSWPGFELRTFQLAANNASASPLHTTACVDIYFIQLNARLRKDKFKIFSCYTPLPIAVKQAFIVSLKTL